MRILNKTKIAILISFLLIALLVFGCGGDKDASSMKTSEPQGSAVKIDENAVSVGDQGGSPLLSEQDIDFRDLEVTPSGEPKCFLSPCDCNCYMIPNVPANKRKATCATDCSDEYGVNGCQYTNLKCATIK